MKLINILPFILLLSACAGVPKHIEPVSGFELERYLGEWYEIARLDHSFERNLEKVKADYSLKDDGSVRVINRGFSTKTQKWKDAEGKAKFAGDPTVGHLKVSFFGPFYGSYVIFELDKINYQYAFVTSSKDSLWLLSRTPTVSQELKERFVKVVTEAGYKGDELIFVNQE